MLAYIRQIHWKEVMVAIWHRKEALIWIIALTALALSNPGDHHYTLCPFHNLGWEFCPGCGIGRSIACFFRMDLKTSFLTHPMGIPAVLIIIHRIFILLSKDDILSKLFKTN